MKLKSFLISGCASAAMLLFSNPAAAAVIHQCPSEAAVSGAARAHLRGEADNIFQNIQSQARHAYYHADQLLAFSRNTQINWDPQAQELTALKSDVNDIENQLCRLDAIQRDLAPWQRAEIRRISPTAHLMADNTEDAIIFGSNHQHDLWLGTYNRYANNLDNEARTLVHSVDRAVNYAKVSQQYRDLRHGMRSPISAD